VTPFGRGRLANGVLISEETYFGKCWCDGHCLNPLDRDEILGLIRRTGLDLCSDV